MKLGFVNIAKFAAVVVSMVIAGSVNAWANPTPCPNSVPNYSPDFSVAIGTTCLALNGSSQIPAPAGSASSITAWSSTGTTVTFTAANNFASGEPVILSKFTNSPFFNTLVLPVQSATSGSFTVTFAIPPGPTSGSETTAVATPMNVLQLTPNSVDQVGSAWDNTQQPVGSSFSTTFYFQLAPGANAGDGFAFVIQNSATTALGDGGCGLGFGDDQHFYYCAPEAGGIPNSLAFVFKTSSSFTSPGSYPNANSVSIQSNNALANCIDTTCNLSLGAENDLGYVNAPTLADGNIHSVTITSTTQPTNAQTGCGAAPGNPVCLDVILDGTDLFPAGVSFVMKTIGVTTPTSTAWVGFTGATSATGFDVTSYSETNDILSWVFTPGGASTTGNIGPTTPTTFNFGGGFIPNDDTTSGFNFSAVLTGSTDTPVKAVLTDLPTSAAVCNGLVKATYPSAQCFVYQNGGGQSVDEPVMFELTCPPTGECISNTGNFPAVLGSQFAFVYGENPYLTTYLMETNFPPPYGTLVFPPATGPFSTPTDLTVDTQLPSVGVLKGQGPDPIHPCTPYPNNTPPLFQSNQVIDFTFSHDTSGGAHGSSGDTNSCWVVTYATQSELPTVSITAPSGNYPVNATPQTASFSCSADNTGASSVVGPYLTVPNGSCVGNSTFDTSTTGSHIYTATVTDSALNTSYQSVTYYVQAAPVFTNSNGTTTYFTVGAVGTPFVITTTGYPVPNLSMGALPGGLSFKDNGDGTGTISGSPSGPTGPGGSFTVQITASNYTGSPVTQNIVTENITVVVDQAPTITTLNTATFTPGSHGTFTVRTTGYPAPGITQDNMSLPSWLTFLDNGDGTATIGGTPPSGMASGSITFTITAANTFLPNATQFFTLNISAGSQTVNFSTVPAGLSYKVDSITYTTPTSPTWTVGSLHSFSVTTPQYGTGTEYTFNNWSVGGSASQTNVAATAGTTIYTASFNTLYQLTTSASTGGSVLPASGSYYAPSTVVNLTATPAAGYQFTSWTGPVANSTSASTTVTMSAAETVKANFSPLPATLTISPTSLNFPNQKNNTSATQTVTLTNNGASAITISSIKIPGSNTEQDSAGDPDDFSFTKTCGSSLAAHASCYIYVTFSADNDNLKPYASLVITDGATGSPQSVPITSNIIDPLISLSSSSMSFGSVTHLTSAAKTVTVKNTGLTALTLSGLAISGTDFAFTTSPPPANSCTNTTVLNPGLTCVIGVTFSPAAKSSYSGQVTITSNALNGATAKISLSGSGK